MFTSQNIFGAISSEKLPIMILVSKSCIHIADNMASRRKGEKRKVEIIRFLLLKDEKSFSFSFIEALKTKQNAFVYIFSFKNSGTVQDFMPIFFIGAQFTLSPLSAQKSLKINFFPPLLQQSPDEIFYFMLFLSTKIKHRKTFQCDST